MILRLDILPLAFLFLAALPTGSAAQAVRGRVIDGESRAPLPTTLVRLLSADSTAIAQAIADDSGRFVIRTPGTGQYRLIAERIGYATASLGPFNVTRNEFTDIQIRLAVRAVPHDALIVATERQIAALEQVGFYQRRRLGFGRFLDREQIEMRAVSRTPELLQGMPGVRMVRSRNGDVIVLRAGIQNSMAGGYCRPRIYIDGVLAGAEDAVDQIPASDIGAIEVFRGPSEIPPQWGGANASCGVILLWTRRG